MQERKTHHNLLYDAGACTISILIIVEILNADLIEIILSNIATLERWARVGVRPQELEGELNPPLPSWRFNK